MPGPAAAAGSGHGRHPRLPGTEAGGDSGCGRTTGRGGRCIYLCFRLFVIVVFSLFKHICSFGGRCISASCICGKQHIRVAFKFQHSIRRSRSVPATRRAGCVPACDELTATHQTCDTSPRSHLLPANVRGREAWLPVGLRCTQGGARGVE